MREKEKNLKTEEGRTKENLRIRLLRQDPTKVSRFIVEDSRKSDKKYGRENNMNHGFVRNLIELGCFYCKDDSIRMTVDRIDNKIGHITSNVVPACIRCNYIRRDMPYEAWLAIVPLIRETREKGLFGNWTGAWQKTRSDFTVTVV